MIDIDTLTDDLFNDLPLVIEGESKEVRYAGKGLVVIRFKPTIYSFTENRCAEVPGSEIPRLRSSAIFLEVLKKAGIRHAYRQVNDRFVLADLILPHDVEFEKYGIEPFIPQDLSDEEISCLARAPPIEIIAKRYLTGTTKHGCVGMAGSCVRNSHPFYKDMLLDPDGALPEILIRFDWRNPLRQAAKGERIALQIIGTKESGIRRKIEEWGSRLADVTLPAQLADLFIDVARARKTAFLAARAIEEFLAEKNIVFYDMCLFIAEDGELMYGEISPDCGRYRHLDLGSLDKDVWRSGGSSQDVIKKWTLLCQLIAQEGKE